MKNLFNILLMVLVIGCKERNVDKKNQFSQKLANELKKMAKADQIAAYIPQGKYKELSEKQWNKFKDSVFTANQKRVEEIFNQYGFVGFDLAGKQGSSNFWLIVQHSDHNTEFQKRVLSKMKIEVMKKNANPADYAFLTDRVNINEGKHQIYGTQVDYNWTVCQAFPKKLLDSTNVNVRRKKIGLNSLHSYLNEMSMLHFETNKNVFLQAGIKKPKLYSIRGK